MRVERLLPRERVSFHGRRLGRRQDGTACSASARRLAVAVSRTRGRRRRRGRRGPTHRRLRLPGGSRGPRLPGRRVGLGRAVALPGPHFALGQFPARSTGRPASFPTAGGGRRDGRRGVVVVVMMLLRSVLDLQRDGAFREVDVHGHGAVRRGRLRRVAFAEGRGGVQDGR